MKVSVLMMTFNHEAFIAEAIHGVLMQKCNFDFELVIGEDNSTDGTRNIILSYQKKYPEKIRPLFREQNMGALENFLDLLATCNSDYYALCDGDDFWISPKKLQNQVDFMDRHPHFSACYTAAKLMQKDGTIKRLLPVEFMKKPEASIDDLIVNESFMPSCTTLFSSAALRPFPNWFHELKTIVDLPLNILNAEYGPIGYLDEITGVYRSNSSPEAFSALPILRTNLEAIRMFELLDNHFNGKYKAILEKKILRNYCSIINESIILGDRDTAYKYLGELSARCFKDRLSVLTATFSLGFKLSFPKAMPRRFFRVLHIALRIFEPN